LGTRQAGDHRRFAPAHALCQAGQKALRARYGKALRAARLSRVEDSVRSGGLRQIDTSVAHVARVYDYLLGGKDNFAADRDAAEKAIALLPEVVGVVKANRAFLVRAVRYLAREAGIRQFLDVGPGIPAAGSTHQVAQAIAPASRVVYADNDPTVILHARALLRSAPEGAIAFLDADLRDPGTILAQAEQTLDFSQPVAVVLGAILHFIGGDVAYDITTSLMAATAPGSYLVISHVANDIAPEIIGPVLEQANRLVAEKTYARSYDEVARFFAGLELVEPGLAAQCEWRPDSDLTTRHKSASWGGVARKS
jgi:S-adenosyl methyltransferase